MMNSRCTPLHNAAGKGFSEIVHLLVQAGADVHIRADKVTLDDHGDNIERGDDLYDKCYLSCLLMSQGLIPS